MCIRDRLKAGVFFESNIYCAPIQCDEGVGPGNDLYAGEWGEYPDFV